MMRAALPEAIFSLRLSPVRVAGLTPAEVAAIVTPDTLPPKLVSV